MHDLGRFGRRRTLGSRRARQALTVAASLLLAGAVLAPAAVQAQGEYTTERPRRGGAGRLRLSGEFSLLGFQYFPDARGVAYPQFRFNFGPVGSTITVATQYDYALSAGYQLTDDIVLGARVNFGFYFLDTNLVPPLDDDFAVGTLGLLPFFEYMFLRGDIRPFVGAQAGFTAFFAEDTSQINDAVIVRLGGTGGVHLFATDSFSVTPWAMLSFLYNSGNEAAGFELLFMLSLDGWLDL